MCGCEAGGDFGRQGLDAVGLVREDGSDGVAGLTEGGVPVHARVVSVQMDEVVARVGGKGLCHSVAVVGARVGDCITGGTGGLGGGVSDTIGGEAGIAGDLVMNRENTGEDEGRGRRWNAGSYRLRVAEGQCVQVTKARRLQGRKRTRQVRGGAGQEDHGAEDSRYEAMRV